MAERAQRPRGAVAEGPEMGAAAAAELAVENNAAEVEEVEEAKVDETAGEQNRKGGCRGRRSGGRGARRTRW